MMQFLRKVLRYILRDVFNRGPLSARRYISRKLGIEGFFSVLNEQKINYSILRWFENLPEITTGEDIDILIADDDELKIRHLFKGSRRNGIACDVYSATGVPGSQFNKIAYFTANFSQQILDNSYLYKNLYRVPNPEYHFWSMAYHAVYHKGYKSGLPEKTNEVGPTGKGDHDYYHVLKNTAASAGIILETADLHSLDKLLQSRGYRPPRDVLEKLSVKNEWVKKLLLQEAANIDESYKGLTVFIVRKRAMNIINKIADLLWDEGFDILHISNISQKNLDKARESIRGGNWTKGIYQTSGGPPEGVIVAFDSSIIPPDGKIRKEHPGLVNFRILKVKNKIRAYYNNINPSKASCNILHSADNAHQAIHYINIVMPEALESFKKEVQLLYSRYKTQYPVIKTIPSQFKRAKVEIIDYHGNQAVCKTYKSGRERFMAREIQAREIGKDLPEMTPIIETGDNFFITPLYTPDQKKLRGFKVPLMEKAYCPLWFIIRCREIICYFRKQGYDFVDLHPDNFIFDVKEGLKLIDFEFLQKTCPKGSDFKGNLSWYPIPEDFHGDRPVIIKKFSKPYRYYWFDCIGLPRFLFARRLPLFFYSILRFLFGIPVIPYLMAKNIYKSTIRKK